MGGYLEDPRLEVLDLHHELEVLLLEEADAVVGLLLGGVVGGLQLAHLGIGTCSLLCTTLRLVL